MAAVIERLINESDLPIVQKMCEDVLGKAYSTVERMGGNSNRTYHVTMSDGGEYVVRIPGEGTEELIVRSDERKSTELGCELGIDAKLYYFGDDGSKVTDYIKGAVTMNDTALQEKHRIEQMAEIFIKLHNCGVDTGVPFEVFDMADGYEKVIINHNVPMYEDYEATKKEVISIKSEVDSVMNIKKVPCHNDALCENWVVDENDRLYLIDWEYAGMNEGMWDLADVSIEAAFGHAEDEMFLKAYLKRDVEKNDWKYFLASKIYVDYLWTLWAKTRVPFDGQPMEDWALERYTRLKKFIGEYRSL